MNNKPLNFLCISSYFKGNAFLEGIKEQGHKVFFLTSKKLESSPWAWDAIDEIYYMNSDERDDWNYKDMVAGVAWLLKSTHIDRVVALDDFDVEKAALLREEFRIPGMGQSTARYFRDKLAMRVMADKHSIPIPAFSSLFNDEAVSEYLQRVEGPWLIKPRSEASATGIQKVHTADEVWKKINELGAKRWNYLIEAFRPGDVYHVDGLSYEGQVVFSRASKYLNTPYDVAHFGGVFRTQTLKMGSEEEKELQVLNQEVMKSFRMEYSAFHSEYIKGTDGRFYFLETSSRVGGANISDMVLAATEVDLWKEWAKIEIAQALNIKYKLPKIKKGYAGVIISLSRMKDPDRSLFSEEEIVTFIEKDFHIGLIVKSSKAERVRELLEKYLGIIYDNFHASAPVPDKPAS